MVSMIEGISHYDLSGEGGYLIKVEYADTG